MNNCELVLVQGLDDANGYAGGRMSSVECCDCESKLCEVHSEAREADTPERRRPNAESRRTDKQKSPLASFLEADSLGGRDATRCSGFPVLSSSMVVDCGSKDTWAMTRFASDSWKAGEWRCPRTLFVRWQAGFCWRFGNPVGMGTWFRGLWVHACPVVIIENHAKE
jgi:hypothetical protein